ncbi:MAG TPA: hypothetical protein VKB78_06960 [Pirellulales bacterium]|nr:hypothetical protein [Pirellulales bacterium]
MSIARKLIAVVLLFSVAFCFGRLLRAADSTGEAPAILKVIPEDALAVVVIPHLDEADEQIFQVAQEMQLPTPKLLPLLKQQSGIQEGFDDHAAAAIALMPGEEGSHPTPVAFIQVSDYKKFLAQLQPEDASAEIAKVTIGGESHVAGKKEDFAVFTKGDQKDLLKKVLDSSRPISPIIGGLSGWIGEHYASFVATPTGVKHGTAAARKALEQVKQALANSGNESTKLMAGNLDAYDWMLSQAEKELGPVGVGLHVDRDGGLHIDTRAMFVSGGSWATSGKSLEGSSGAKLTCLPSGPFFLVFAGAMPQSLSKSFMNMSVDMFNNMAKAAGGKELGEEQKKKLDSLMEKAMGQLKSMAMVVGTPKPGGSFYSNMAGVFKVTDSKRYITEYQDLLKSMADLMKQSGVDFPFPKEAKKIKIDDLDGYELTMDMSAFLNKIAGNNPAAKQMMQMMFGPEGKLNIYLAAIDDTTVALSYVTPDAISRVKAACSNVQSSLASDADIAQTTKLLPDGAQWVVYLSPKGLFDFITTAMQAAAPPGGAMPALPPFPQTPPIGFGAETSGTRFDAQIVLPGPTLKGIGTYVMQMKGMFAPGGGAARPQIR